MENRIKTLKCSPIFQDLDVKALDQIAAKFEDRPFKPNDLIFDDGSQDVDGMYVIGDGIIKIFKYISEIENKQQTVVLLRKGSYFGEMALLDEATRSAGAISLNNSNLLFLSKQSFDEIINDNVEVAHSILNRISRVMSQRLRHTNDMFKEVVAWGYKARKEVDELKSNFLSTISHELRTPLNSIQGFSSLMIDESELDVDTQKKFINIILNESKRLGNLVNGLITLAEMQFDSNLIDPKENNLLAVVRQIYDDSDLKANKQKVKISLKAPDKDINFLFDSNKIGETLYYLVDNAIKFNREEGNVTIEVIDSSDEARIKVIDTGIGIPSEQFERIFDNFYQVDQSMTREFEGAGIGLANAKKIVDQHGGKILVESELDKGSTFTVILPKK